MDVQKQLFDWIVNQPVLTALTIFATGFAYGFWGLRLIRILVVFPCAGVGCVLGALAAGMLRMPVLPVVGVGGLAGGVLGAVWPRGGTAIAGAATWAALLGFLCARFDAPEMAVLGVTAAAGLVGLVLTLVSRQSMVVLFTTLQGAGLIVLGFVGLSSNLVPSLGTTFRNLAQHHAIVIPLLLVMISVTAYSYQAAARQGDIFTGVQSQPRV